MCLDKKKQSFIVNNILSFIPIYFLDSYIKNIIFFLFTPCILCVLQFEDICIKKDLILCRDSIRTEHLIKNKLGSHFLNALKRLSECIERCKIRW